MDRFFVAVWETATVIGGLVAIAVLCFGAYAAFSGGSDVTLAASAAFAAAITIVPYCIAGALHRALGRRRD